MKVNKPSISVLEVIFKQSIKKIKQYNKEKISVWSFLQLFQKNSSQ